VSGEDIHARRDAAIAQQVRVVSEPAPFFVEACPGSGKTRVIVDRHVADPTPRGRPGRALVSFTRASAGELRARCRAHSRPDLAEYPHFIGTIDRFFWLYLVRPACLPLASGTSPRRWQRIESWDRIQASVYGGWALADFTFRRDPGEQQCRAELRPTERNRGQYEKANDQERRDAEDSAVLCRDRLMSQGYITGHEVRVLALQNVRTDAARTRTGLLNRFGEVVVDEAQDCSALDLAILHTLRTSGLPIVLVGDLNQAIYAFRGAQPHLVRRFASDLGTQLPLSGNWRSSPAICSFAHTLRPATGHRRPDDAVGQHHAEPSPVVLLTSKKNQIDSACAAFHAQADTLEIPPSERLIVAHASIRLPGSAQWRNRGTQHAGTKQLVWAAAVIEHRDPDQLELALEIIERALLRIWSGQEIDGASIEAVCDAAAIDRNGLRAFAATLTLPSLDLASLKDWCTEANLALRRTPPAPHLIAGNKGRLAARKPAAAQPPRKAIGIAAEVDNPVQGRCEVVHQVKGREADAVLLVIPDDHRLDRLLAQWEVGADDEALRVLYVAATRARRLLAVSVPERCVDRVEAHLARHGVPTNRKT
jgi:DNA helicase II / ATP-dependent DNA helicase PcrA